ncbi:uncharacterized protein LOC131245361 isoform X1 [Magnolia sinica]|uniref:uncharacterized protein LOC131245361 isoform X1 n=1 Tax=Magnolia sinica TaxID=86752 RepID=UPI00265B60B0|nr:uncharacterized protein LOC131245361 isoform X1 [Magnolia sinica]XP_058100748.1 uncharacterized protein LOC131245361 isoform X1 [Magnolia sinica]XP_058100750.1 uncharacterized protein LOC131245361 isoform X1 [Magnolia sinica]
MFKMDLKSKGITWVGNIYQKFESMCQEVDGLMSQEKVKYVKSQVQTSCETVQKLCTEAMQELIPLPSTSSVKGHGSDMPLIYDHDMVMGKKSKVDFEECPLNEKPLLPSQLEASVSMDNDSSAAPLLDGSQGVDHVEACDTPTKKSTPIPVEVTEHKHPESAGEYSNDSDAISCIDDHPSVLQSELALPAVSHEKVVENGLIPLGLVSSVDVTDSGAEPLLDGPQRVNHVEACDTPTEKSTECNHPERAGKNNKVSCLRVIQSELVLPVVSPQKVVENGLISPTDVTERCESLGTISLLKSSWNKREQRSKPSVLEASMWPPEIAIPISLHGYDCKDASRSADAVGPSAETVEFEDVRLDDDSLDSEEERDEIYLIALQASKKRSYKKKLQDAFISRIRAVKKHDHEQMVAWYRDFNNKTKQRGDLNKMQTDESIDSDWELL